MTVRRAMNLLLLRSSYYLSRILKYPFQWGLPYSLSIEPTTACNLSCPECPSGLKAFTRATGKLDISVHERMLHSVSTSVFYINYYFQGEPFLHPDFLTLIRAAKKRNIYTSTSTNAHFITKEKAEEIVQSGLDRIIISLDGLTQETYSNYRVNGSMAKVVEGTKALVKAKKELGSHTPFIILQFLAVKQNEEEIPAVFNLGKELNIDEVRIKTAQFYDYQNGHKMMPVNQDFTRYKRMKDGTYRLKYNLYNACWRMWSGCVFTWDGKVVPCCFDKDANYQIGDVNLQEFKKIWTSPAYTQFRRSVLSNRQNIDICTNCSEGTKVWI